MPSVNESVGAVIGVGLALFISAIILPMSLNTMANATMTNVDPNVVIIVQVLLPILAVLAIALYFLRSA